MIQDKICELLSTIEEPLPCGEGEVHAGDNISSVWWPVLFIYNYTDVRYIKSWLIQQLSNQDIKTLARSRDLETETPCIPVIDLQNTFLSSYEALRIHLLIY